MGVPAEKTAALSPSEKDKKFLWHPFTQFSVWQGEEPLVVDRAESFYLFDEAGNRYLDGVSSIWCNVHGHNHPELTSTLHKQADKLVHSTLLGLSHTPVVELGEKLAQITPKGLDRSFFADSGSNAVEAAIRMAVEHAALSGEMRPLLGSLDSAYHGDTLGAVGVGYLGAFHGRLSSVTVQAKRIRPPHVFRINKGLSEKEAEAAAINEAEVFFKQFGEKLAAFIIEPLVQGAAGIWLHSADYLKAMRRLTSDYGVTLIADEVATGFCKTGEYFACQKAGVVPDLLAMGKGLSAGLLPISAVACKNEIFESFIGRPSEMKTFFYGQTYAGNPLASAVSAVNLGLITEPTFLPSLRERIAYFSDLVSTHIKPLENVFEVRQNGLMTGIELTRVPGKFVPFNTDDLVPAKITAAARRRGCIIRPLGNVMILMPAPAMPAELLEELVLSTAEVICHETGRLLNQ